MGNLSLLKAADRNYGCAHNLPLNGAAASDGKNHVTLLRTTLYLHRTGFGIN